MNYVYATLNVLREQTLDSRRSNILRVIADELDKQFDLKTVDAQDLLAELVPPARFEQLSKILARVFPFLSEARAFSLVGRANTLDNLVSHVNFEVGA